MSRPVVAIDIPNFLPKWHFLQPAGRLIWASVIFVLALGFVMFLISKPKPVEPPTWAQCMLGAVATFALMLLAYGTIPHEWLNFSNSYMKWNAAKFIVHGGQKIGPIHWLNFDINKQALSDTGAVVIYAVMLTLNVILISKWQKRPIATDTTTASSAEERVVGESAYGRPVTVKG